ncbi:MAG TPA: tetratricopeptide repeat-containing glycosyltransferase family protein [Xanthobacteraceae bacterium]|jgi:tetratricopeptide (TPR) repeat protein|nr:tetratricopeptide repeat-containing glycosyltransferase family protein [Xanthobacteraceae bacterium]
MAKYENARRSRFAGSIGQALALQREGRLDDADRICGDVLGADPHHFEALYLSGMLRHQQGSSLDGLRMVAAALKAKPGAAEARMDYGVMLLSLGHHEEALASFDQVLATRTGDAALHYNRGNALMGLGRFEDALASYDRAVALAPHLAVAHHNRGSTLAALDRYEEALASFDRALAHKQDSADRANTLTNRGRMLAKLKRFDEALPNYDQVLALAPNHVDALTRRGVALAGLGRHDEALAAYTAALHVDPDYVDAYVNRGNAYAFLKQFAAALADYAAVTARQPEHADANFNEGLVRLCLGDFRGGWPKYEYRWQRKEFAAARPNFPRPLWRGEEPLQGKTILLCAEQGMGDVIHFVRYAPLLAALGAKVLVGVHRPLTDMVASVPGVSQTIADGDTLPDFDLYVSLLSLPLIFGTELETIPSTVPYIRADEIRVARWRTRVPQNGRLRVGICWAGGTAHVNDRNRSINFESFAKLLTVEGVDFVGLQKDIGEADSTRLRELGAVSLGPEFQDFTDTAAVLSLLDLVITVDTSVAHLAGAMGKATAVLLPFSPDFRWLLERTDSPWYPTMRLYRQNAIGDWETPLERLRQELTAVAQRRAKPAQA